VSIDWGIIGKLLPASTLVLLIIIFWLMRQNAQLVSVAFKTYESIEKLRGCIETLTRDQRSCRDQCQRK